MENKTPGWLRWANIAAFIATLIVNGLSNTTLIGGQTTAEVSNRHPTLITPAGYVFSIWGIIYVLLGVYLVYQALPSQKNRPFQKQISYLFILTSILNIVWLFFWQNELLSISVAVILGFLASLIAIYLRLHIGRSNVSLKEKLCVHVPFSVYLGWVTIATIANIAVTLTASGWDGLGLSMQTWAIVVLALALIIDLAVIVTRRDIAFSLVFIWALAGIAVNQTSYPNVALTAEIAIVVIAVALALAVAVTRLRRR
ncbi:MAG: tryptophan-rich sensory protein [Candidatus Bathyarchaeota archaeon]|nr:tryptophan-rich sensory protein [Candidatus Bathyarchaeota archaeon]